MENALPIKKKGNSRKIILRLLFVIIVLIAVPPLVYYYVTLQVADEVYENVALLPKTHTVLLLGTAKNTASGNLNDFFARRIEAAALLYKHHKVETILLSGDNNDPYYNEPRDMRNELLQKGVPEFAVRMDYAGFRTFDSVVRAHLIFKEKNFVIVSQRFHVERALFIAKAKGISAIGFVAPDVRNKHDHYRILVREAFARMQTLLDCYILNTEPQVLAPIEDTNE